jgi:hypothetical protein
VGNIGYYEITNSASCAVLSIRIIKQRRYCVFNVETEMETRIVSGKLD